MPVTMTKQQLLTQVYTVLKKKIPASGEPETPHPILEEVLYAILREGVTNADADAAFLKIKTGFVDLNEMRVSSVQEVADAIADLGLADAGNKAERIVKFLQEHFERTYSFALDELEKKGLKQASKQLARYKDHGVSDFVVAWVMQRSLEGHAIPLDEPTIRVLQRLGAIDTEIDDLEATRASLEHYIPKATGIDFTDRIIQLATTICLPENPHCAECPLLSICPTGQERIKAGKAAKAKPKSR